MIGDRKTIVARYYNSNYYAVAIVASITEGIDWAAYIGGADYLLSEKEAVEYVRDYGDKLSRKDAIYFFPNIKLPYRLWGNILKYLIEIKVFEKYIRKDGRRPG